MRRRIGFNLTVAATWMCAGCLPQFRTAEPNERQIVKLTRSDGSEVTCIAPPVDVTGANTALSAGVGRSAEDTLVARAIDILEADISIEQKFSRIREETSGIQAAEILDYRLCIAYGSDRLDRAVYQQFISELLPRLLPRRDPAAPTDTATPSLGTVDYAADDHSSPDENIGTGDSNDDRNFIDRLVAPNALSVTAMPCTIDTRCHTTPVYWASAEYGNGLIYPSLSFLTIGSYFVGGGGGIGALVPLVMRTDSVGVVRKVSRLFGTVEGGVALGYKSATVQVPGPNDGTESINGLAGSAIALAGLGYIFTH